MASCTAPLNAATAAFGPGANATSSPTSSAISSALDSVCASSCDDQTLRELLSQFYSGCTPELTSNPNPDVIRTYDVLYALTPFKAALCTKDSNGAYCATEATSSASSATNNQVDIVVPSGGDSPASSLKKYLWSATTGLKRATADTTAALIPNVTTYKDSNLLFFFLKPDTPSAQLCTTCARSVLLSYIQFQTSVPYAPGLGVSPLMGGQGDLYSAMTKTCGATFFTGGVSAVGGIASGMLGSSGAKSAASRTQIIGGTAALLAGAVGFVGLML